MNFPVVFFHLFLDWKLKEYLILDIGSVCLCLNWQKQVCVNGYPSTRFGFFLLVTIPFLQDCLFVFLIFCLWMCGGGACVLLSAGGSQSRSGSASRVFVRDHQNRGVAYSKGLHHVLLGKLLNGVCQFLLLLQVPSLQIIFTYQQNWKINLLFPTIMSCSWSFHFCFPVWYSLNLVKLSP